MRILRLLVVTVICCTAYVAFAFSLAGAVLARACMVLTKKILP